MGWSEGRYFERDRFGRVGRIPTPVPLPVAHVNSYLVLPPAGSDRLTLIDTGVKSPESFEALRAGFKRLGHSLEQIDRILCTHAHMDHFGQAKRIREISGATVYASEIEAERMKEHWSPSAQGNPIAQSWMKHWGVPEEVVNRGNPQMKKFAESIQDPIEVDEILAEGDTLELGEFTIEVIETPGHCEGHIVFYERDMKLLFAGDHLLTDISPVPLLSFPEPGEERQKSLIRLMHSWERMEELECKMVFPSHGDVILDHHKLIAGYRLHHDRRKLQFRRYLQENGPQTAYQLAQRMFEKYYESQLFLVMSEVVGHLDLLVEEGAVVPEDRDGVEYLALADGARE